MAQIFSLFLIILLAARPAGKETCKDLREGVFSYKDVGGEYIVRRTADKQIEISKQSEFEMQFNIRWVDDCTYLLFNVQVLNDQSQIFMESLLQELGDTLVNEISEINGNEHTVVSYFPGGEKTTVKLKRLE